MNRSNMLKMFTIVLFATILSGCVKTNNLSPLNKKIPPEECAILVIPRETAVKRIDGAKHGWVFSTWRVGFWAWSRGSKAAKLRIPAGEHTIICEYSHPQDGWKADKLQSVVNMSAGKMYMLSVTLDDATKVGTGSRIINIATSFYRDQIIDMVPGMGWLPRANPKGMVYQINEIDQATLDQHLLGIRTLWKDVILGILVGIIWTIIVVALRALLYFIFMGKFKNSHAFTAFILSFSFSVAGVLVINYNLSGNLFFYLLSTILMGIGASRRDLGSRSASEGYIKLHGNDFKEAISKYDSAILMAPYNADYRNNRGLAYCHLNNSESAIEDFTKAIELKPNAMYLNNRGTVYYALQDWEKAAADFSAAVRLKPNNDMFKKNLANAQAQIAGGSPGTSSTVSSGGRAAAAAVSDKLGGLEMVFVNGGTFEMGATKEQGSDSYDYEKPVHSVTLDDYYMGMYPVTQKLWTVVMGSNPSKFIGDNLPVGNVNLDYIVNVFIPRLNAATGNKYRLPTEAEWEYAARGGVKSKKYKYSGSNNIDDVAWYKNNSGGKVREIGTKKANELGIFDMSGNICEWVSDWYGDYTPNPQKNPTGPAQGLPGQPLRLLRGGDYSDAGQFCRVSARIDAPNLDFPNFGFRLAHSR